MQREEACKHTCVRPTLCVGLLQWPKYYINTPESQGLEKLVHEKTIPNIMFSNLKILGIW